MDYYDESVLMALVSAVGKLVFNVDYEVLPLCKGYRLYAHTVGFMSASANCDKEEALIMNE
ncbi:hypothetical protein CR513_34824, partial [Mucuna pruriens]